MRKTKLLKIYQDRKSGALFVRSTKVDENDDFVLKSAKDGKALGPKKTSNEELGMWIRKILEKCE